jgi:hypothetical protein
MRQGLKKPISLHWVVESLFTLIHLSVILFLAGFVINLFTLNHLVAIVACICAGFAFVWYLYFSVAVIFSRDSPYNTPLTTILWVIPVGIIALFFRFCHFITSQYSNPEEASRLRGLFAKYHQQMSMTTGVEKLANKTSSSLTYAAVIWTFNSIGDDCDMEQFLSGLPGFYASTMVQQDEDTFEGFNSEQLPSSILPFMLSSDLLTEPKKQKRIAICLRAINAHPLLLQSTFRHSLQDLNPNLFRCTDFVRFALDKLRHYPEPWVKDYAQCIVAIAINRVCLQDNPAWIDIVQHSLKSQHARYQRESHNRRLCNLIYLTQRLMASQLANSDQFLHGGVWYNVLVEARELDVRGTAYRLQNEFRTLWNELDNMARDEQFPQRIRVNAYLIISVLGTVHARLPIL